MAPVPIEFEAEPSDIAFDPSAGTRIIWRKVSVSEFDRASFAYEAPSGSNMAVAAFPAGYFPRAWYNGGPGGSPNVPLPISVPAGGATYEGAAHQFSFVGKLSASGVPFADVPCEVTLEVPPLVGQTKGPLGGRLFGRTVA